MANDRLYLRCRLCKDVEYLAKWTCSGWYRNYLTEDDDAEGWSNSKSRYLIGDAFVTFADAHQYCLPPGGEGVVTRGSWGLQLLHEDELPENEEQRPSPEGLHAQKAREEFCAGPVNPKPVEQGRVLRTPEDCEELVKDVAQGDDFPEEAMHAFLRDAKHSRQDAARWGWARRGEKLPDFVMRSVQAEADLAAAQERVAELEELMRRTFERMLNVEVAGNDLRAENARLREALHDTTEALDAHCARHDFNNPDKQLVMSNRAAREGDK